MDEVIKIDKLSKRYSLRRNMPRYSSLRDELTQRTKNGISRLLGRSSLENSPIEEFWALKDVSLSIGRGDRIGVVGRNGAGKSTLLKILSRITDPTEGAIEIVGRVSSLLEVGTGFHPELSGRENIYLNGAILGMRKEEIRRKFDNIVQFAEVDRFLDTPVKRYSSGMYVRLAFAVAAHLEPDVLIVDEVLAVGDVQFQKKCLGRMDELSRDGRTILFVTHNMDAMTTLCNRAVILDKGRLVFDGSTNEARQMYVGESAKSEYSVERNSGRGGSGGILIESVSVDVPGRLIISGDALILSMKARVSNEYLNRNDIQVSFAIDSIDGQRITTLISLPGESDELDPSSGILSVACEIDSFPVVAGQYLVSCTIIFRGDTLDCVIHCATFNVLPRPRTVHLERLPDWGPIDIRANFYNQ